MRDIYCKIYLFYGGIGEVYNIQKKVTHYY